MTTEQSHTTNSKVTSNGDGAEEEKKVDAVAAWKASRRNRRRERSSPPSPSSSRPFDGVERQGGNRDDGVGGGSGVGVGSGVGSGEYVPYVSAAKRIKKERLSALHSKRTLRHGEKEEGSHERDRDDNDNENDEGNGNGNDNDDDCDGPTPSSSRWNGTDKTPHGADPSSSSEGAVRVTDRSRSLLDEATALHSRWTSTQQAAIARDAEESRILREASQVQTNALQAAGERAKGVKYQVPLRTTWTPPRYLLRQGPEAWRATRAKWHILVEEGGIDGDNDNDNENDDNDIRNGKYACPPPIQSFAEMKLPMPILNVLREKNIERPTPIQMQGLPVALAGRDMVGIAFTGSGKTLTFALPMVMAALEEEIRMPLRGREGPIGFSLAPSRELARQTFEVVQQFCDGLRKWPGLPQLRAQLLIGGENSRRQAEPILSHGVHCLVATPGRLRDFLKRGTLRLDHCRYVCLDEADRMLDLGFDEEVAEIMNHFRHQRQTLLFSATFPKKFRDFAKTTLVQPVVVNVGRAGAANLDVIQEVEYVKQEAKIVYLLECLQKTAPPVIVFCEKKQDVDDIHEYLLLKGVSAVGIHGGKDQDERNEAIRDYKAGRADVLVATDVAAKGLDFSNIQHVVNFDMPAEIENYVHRIGRTGRCGKTGVATTFINKSCEETTLLDLKHLLLEAKQRIPPVLLVLDDHNTNTTANTCLPVGDDGPATGGCSFCGGLGHTILHCPKIDKDARRVAGGHRDAIASGEGYGGDW